MSIHVDFETRSALNLKNTGIHRYARHDSTSVLCLAFSLDSGENVEVWRAGDPPPEKLFAAISAGKTINAHNSMFEELIWQHICVERMGWPSCSTWRCTMRMCAYAGLPLSLEKAAEWLELEVEKDRSGKAMMTKMAKASNAKDDTEEKWQRLMEYCAMDVRVEAEIHKALSKVNSINRVEAFEEDMVVVDRAINDRGVPIDRETCQNIVRVLDVEKKRLNQELRELTDGQVKSGQQVAVLIDWLNTKNLPVADCKKETIKASLAVVQDPDVRRALEIRQATSQGSTSKIKKMLEGIESDGRTRGVFQHYGASQTGRWAGRRIQLQNLPRLTTNDIMLDVAVQAFKNVDPTMLEIIFGDCITGAKQMIRPLVKSDRGLVVADYAQIELRVAAWLAGEKRLLDIFANDDDAYIGMAGKIFEKPPAEVNKSERFVGKVVMLGCQYQMGAKRFKETLEQFGVKGTDEELQALADKSVPAFRELHPNIKRLWSKLSDAAVQAFRDNKKMRVGRLTFLRPPGTDRLLMILPSGRPLHYWFVKCEDGEYGPSLTHKAIRQNKIVRAGLYGGRWLENAAQAVSRDLLKHALVKLDGLGQEVIGHVHDEVLVEGGDRELVEKTMTRDLPDWAAGLPVKVEAFNCERYTK